MFPKILKSMSSKLAMLTLTTFFISPHLLSQSSSSSPRRHIFNSLWSLFSPIKCIQTQRSNKPQIIKLLNQTKQELLILVYNRQSQNQLKQQILKCQQIGQKIGIKKLVLVDQTDIRHLETFTKILREDIDDDFDHKNQKQPVNLQGKIKILYSTPNFNSSKPFLIQSLQSLQEQVREYRSLIKLNPTQQQLQSSIETFNKTTIIKNCYNDTCVDQFTQKIRKLAQLQLFRNKSQNFGFFVTTSKPSRTRISQTVQQSPNKQQIYIFQNDMLGKSRRLYSEFLEKEGKQYQNQSQFMMAIRPRVHVLSKGSYTTDLFWFVTVLRLSSAAVFSVNNTLRNMPVRIQVPWGQEGDKGELVWMNGHVQEVQFFRKLKDKYGKELEILVVQSNAGSQLIRHLYQPERYCIFNLAPKIPYPKMLIKPPTLPLKIPQMQKIPYSQPTISNSSQLTSSTPYPSASAPPVPSACPPETDSSSSTSSCVLESYSKVLQKIDSYLRTPKSYSPIMLYSQKQRQINGKQVKQLLQKNVHNRWILRVCGQKNYCLYSVYQKYGIDLRTPVYKINANLQNVAIQEADYEVVEGKINKID